MKNEIGFEIKMVPEARLELARLERRGILNPLYFSLYFTGDWLAVLSYIYLYMRLFARASN